MSTLLITGGTGSFGSTVLKRYLKDPRYSEIRIFSRDEKKQFDMMNLYRSPKLKFLIGDTRQFDSVERALEGVDYVFHAAALKQVPTGEFFPLELVKTNILGTENVFRAARRTGVKKVILLSTDKAVYPVNTMGMTKALAEKLMTSYALEPHPTTVCCAVRYGNVMASRGSVIPLFIDQILQKKDITITDPRMTRFMLSLEDAVNLVEVAFIKGEPGNIFVKKSPATTMEHLARALLDIFNGTSKIKIIGMRKGEKVHETLVSQTELMQAEDLGDFFKISTGERYDYDKYFSKGTKKVITEDYTSGNADFLDEHAVKKLLLTLPYVKEMMQKKR